MAFPTDSAQPRLAPGCRWGNSGEDNKVLLFPEGALRLQGTGQKIVELCDGQHTFSEIVGALQTNYNASDPSQIRQDIASFLEQLRRKRIVDY
jgi:pyrroloquinoline quinone biosynthesis protein D